MNNDLIYDYLCPCEATYIGETQQLLHERILQHRRNKDGVLHLHIKVCPKYIEKFENQYSVEQTMHQSLSNEIFSKAVSQS